ncbi:SRPBCC family protein [Terrabacter sp. C0L_2]|uniref:SRPBCC family protein n=1 Tax=Terrabacter sp. C0L_2 TaxID=3108389 RepID=UPI002ED019C7|nr:SRPBCC family protein [Terrabacter sp. C0L_2]
MRFDIETRASPEQVRRALTDFSDARVRTWHRTLDAKTYAVLGQGESWAEARESSPGSPFWVVARYDWSDPEVVRWTVTDSSYGGGGDGLVRVTPGVDGGSRVHAEWRNVDPRRQKLLLFLLRHGPASAVISRMWTASLDRYATADGT